MESEAGSLLFAVVDGIATLTLNRPEQGNAVDEPTRAALIAAWGRVNDDPAIGVCIITGAGERFFSTGADAGRLGKAAGEGDAQALRAAGPGGWGPRHFKVGKPVICAVNGLVNGGALHLVAEADLVLATRNAAFMDNHVSIGQAVALENVALARRLPFGTVMRMTLMGKSWRLPAERAWQLGLVDELFETRESLLEGAHTMARAMLANSPSAMRRSRAALWDAHDLTEAESVRQGWNLICDQREHPDAREGPLAFREKRAPRWLPE